MALFKGKTVTVNRPVEEVFARISNMGEYQSYLDQLPDQVKAQVGNVKFESDAIIINAAPVGEIVLRVNEKVEPSRMVLKAENAPIDMGVIIDMEAETDATTAITPAIDVAIPEFARALVGPKMQQAADMMGNLFSTLFKA